MTKPGKTLARIVAAATLLVAACLLASPGAHAHPGHVHAVPHAMTTNIDVVDVAAIATTQKAALAHINAVAQAPAPDDSDAHACTLGCCGIGTGCCPAWLAALPDLQPPSYREIAVVAIVHAGTGVVPDALPEPPKANR